MNFFVKVESLVLYFFFVLTHQEYWFLSLALYLCLSVWKMEIPVSMAVK
jgi:hypothetical protein